jgi:hypothetical protein
MGQRLDLAVAARFSAGISPKSRRFSGEIWGPLTVNTSRGDERYRRQATIRSLGSAVRDDTVSTNFAFESPPCRKYNQLLIQ